MYVDSHDKKRIIYIIFYIFKKEKDEKYPLKHV